jgi:hypothetical protein
MAMYGMRYGMIKTTVYLPAELKAQIERLAAETGRSQSDILREGIREGLAIHAFPTPARGMIASGGLKLSERVDELLNGFGEYESHKEVGGTHDQDNPVLARRSESSGETSC